MKQRFLIEEPPQKETIERIREKTGAGIAYFPDLCKHAFTLAEVIITIGVIGVVAAMTLSALIQKYEKHIIEVGLKKTYSDLYNLIKRSEVDNGSYETWDYSNSYENGKTEQFVEKYFAPYIHLTQCKAHNGDGKMPCFAGSDGNFYVWRVPNQEKLDIGGAWRVSPKYLLDDGRSIMIQVNQLNNYGVTNAWEYITFVVDVNGQRGRSVIGEDVFAFSLSNYLRYGDYGKPIKGFHVGNSQNDGDWAYSTEQIKTNLCNPDKRSNFTACGILLERNGWKFPKDYPIKF